MQLEVSSLCRPLAIYTQPLLVREEAENLLERQRRLIERIGFESTRLIEEKLRRILSEIAADSIASPPRSHVVVLRAAWGYGKTHYGRIVLPKLAQERKLAYTYRNFEDIIDQAIGEAEEKGLITPNEAELRLIARKTIEKLLREALQETGGKPLILFLDEVEARLEATTEFRGRLAAMLLEELLVAMKQLMRSDVAGTYKGLAGSLHLILATTPEVYYTVERLAESTGLRGRILRRIDVVDLLPFSRNESRRLAETILIEHYGFPANSVSQGLYDVLHIISGGNPGILIRLVNSLVRESYIQCRSMHQKDCYCSLDNPLLVAKLLSRIKLPYTLRGKLAPALDKKVVEALFNIADIDFESALAISSSIVFSKPLEEEEYFMSQSLLQSLNKFGISMYEVKLYLLGSLDRANALLRKAALELEKLFTNREDAYRVVEELSIVLPDGTLAITLPVYEADYEEVKWLLYTRGYRLDYLHVRRLIESLEETLYGVEIRNGYLLRPTKYSLIYPASSIKIIPFIRDPEAAMELYEEITSLKDVNISTYSMLALTAFKNALETSELTTNANTSLAIEIKGIQYAVPFILELYINRLHAATLPERRPAQEKPVVIIRLYTPTDATPPRTPANYYSIDAALMPHDVDLLAAAALALSNEKYQNLVDNETLGAFYKSIIEKTMSDYDKKIARKLYEDGIAIPLVLPGEEELGSPEAFLNAYKMLLIGAVGYKTDLKINLEDIAELLYRLYSIRPYRHGKGNKWCDTVVPSVLYLDLEPDDHRAFYIDEHAKKYLRGLREKLKKIAYYAVQADLLEPTEGYPNVYSVKIHPIERRLIKILTMLRLEECSQGIAKVKEFFIYPSDDILRSRAEKLLESFFCGLIRARLPRGRHEEIKDLKEIIEVLEEFAKDTRPFSDLGSIGDSLALALFKEKGVKVIEPSHLVNTMRSLLEKKVLPNVVAEFTPLLRSYLNFYKRAYEIMLSRLNEVRKAGQDAEKALNETNEALSKAAGIVLETGGLLSNISSEETVKRILAQALERSQTIIDELKTKSMRELKKRYKELASILRFDNCKNRYGFSILAYALEKTLEEHKYITELFETIKALRGNAKEIKKLVEEISSLDPRGPLEVKRAILSELKLKTQSEKYKIIIQTPEQLQDLVKKIYNILVLIKDNLIKCIKIIEMVNNLNKKLVNSINSAQKRLEELSIEMYKTKTLLEAAENVVGSQVLHNVKTELNELERIVFIKQYSEELDAIARAAEKEKTKQEHFTCSNIDAINYSINSLERLLRDVDIYLKEINSYTEHVINIRKRIAQAVIEYVIEPLEARRERLATMNKKTQIISKAMDISKKISEAGNAIEKAKGAIYGREPPQILSSAIEEAKRKLEEASNLLREVIIEEVGEEGYQVLIALQQNPLTSSIRLHQLVERLSLVTGLRREKVLEALLKLDEKDFLEARLTP